MSRLSVVGPSGQPSTATSKPTAVKLVKINKAFGDVGVLSNISLEIAAGSFLVIVGRSGSGKSTLLRLIMGLDKPTSGEVVFEKDDPRRIMFQEPRLLPWKRVRENVEVGLGSRPSANGPGAALQALADVGLVDRAQDWPGILSGGQKQRVALARALVSQPRLLALDEPLGALDALTRIDMQALIETVWRDLGFTAVLVTHDVAEAITLADRILVLEEGRIGLDIAVDLPRPRRRSDPRFADLEEKVLSRLLNRPV